MRLFYALWPDPPTRAALAEVAAGMECSGGRRVPAANLHLTLHFLGEVDPAVATALRAASCAVASPAFVLEIAAAGWWRSSRVAWLAPLTVPAALIELAAAIRWTAQARGLALRASDPVPHITVARKLARAPRPCARPFSVPWTVRDFALVASRTDPAGVRYEVLEQWPLASP